MNLEIESVFAQIGDCLKRTLCEIPAPEGTVYACAFWLFYLDHTVIAPPNFAYNFDGGEEDVKWSPPNWHADVVERVNEALDPLYQELSGLMKGQDDDAWGSLGEYQWHFFAQLCRSITRDPQSLLKGWHLTDNYVCGIFEEREDGDVYTRLVKESVGEQTAIELGILSSGD